MTLLDETNFFEQKQKFDESMENQPLYLINFMRGINLEMFFFFSFFSIWVFFHEHSRTTGLPGKGEAFL